MKITLKQIKDKSPCKSSWEELLKSYGKTKADNTQVTIEHLLATLDIPDTLWVIDHLYKDKRKVQLMCAEFAKRVLHIWEDWAKDNCKQHFEAPRRVIELIEQGASQKEIKAAAPAAYAAVEAAYASAANAHAAYTAADAAAYAAANAHAAYTAADAAAYAADAADAAHAAYAAEYKAQEKIILKYFGSKNKKAK